MFSSMWEGVRYRGKWRDWLLIGAQIDSNEQESGVCGPGSWWGDAGGSLRKHSSSCFEFLSGREARSKLAL